MTGAGLWETLSRAPLFLDRTSMSLAMDRAEIERFYEPLARAALGRAQPGRREIVAVAGPPGSGKTAFATTLVAVIDALAGQEIAALVGLDGWHYSNAYLDDHTIERGGEVFPLRRIKGAPETYDQALIRAFLARAHGEESLAYPAYSRELHDPIAGAAVLREWHQIIVLEGNYWLLDEAPWNTYWPLFDLRVFLSADPADLLAGLRERHLRGGKTPEFVEAHMLVTDVPNIARVLEHAGPADVVVRKQDSRRIGGMAWFISH